MPVTSAGAVQLDLVANAKNFIKQADAAAGVVRGSWNKLAGVLGGGLVFSGLAAFSTQAIKLASDLQEVQNVVDVTFPTMSEKVNEFAANAAQQFGLSGTMARQYAGRLGSMAEAMGFTEQQAYEMATAMTGLAGDVASFYNLSADEAYEKLTAVFTGQVRPLMALGVVMNQTTLDAYAMANGYGKVTSEMTEAEKAALRLDFVQHSLANATGDFARTSGSWANQMRLLSLNFGQFSATVGQVLIAVLLPVVRVLNTIISAATLAAKAIANLISLITGKSMDELTGGISSGAVAVDGLAASTGALSDAQEGAAGSAGKQAAAQKELNRTLAAFDRINKLSSQSDSGGGGGGGGGVGGLNSALASATENANALADAFGNFGPPTALTMAFERLAEAFTKFTEIIGGAFAWAFENILKPFGEWLVNSVLPHVLNMVADAFRAINVVLETLGPALDFIWQTFFRPLAETLGGAISGALQTIADAFRAIGDFAEANPTLFTTIAAGIAAIVGHNAALGVLGSIVGTIFWTIANNPIAAIITGIAIAIGLVRDHWEEIKDSPIGQMIQTTIDNLKELWHDVLEPFAGMLNDVLTKAFEAVGDAISNPLGFLGDLWDKIMEFLGLGKDKSIDREFQKVASNVVKGAIVGITRSVPGLSEWLEEWWSETKEEVEEDPIEIRAEDRTPPGIRSAQRGLAMVPATRMVNIFGSDKTQESVTSASKNLNTLKDRTIKLAASNLVATGVTSANDYIAKHFTDKTTKLNATNNVSSVVDAINKKVLNGKTSTLKAIDNASPVINNVNNKPLYNKEAKLYFTPELTKKNIGMSVTGGGKNIALYTFAQGGYVERNTPRLAIIGDNTREGEIVSPESKFQTMLDKAAQMGGSSSTDDLLRELISVVRTMDPTVVLDGRSITRSVVNNINSQTQATGRSPLII